MSTNPSSAPTPSAASSVDRETVTAGRARSPWERILVWSGILFLVAVGGFEYFTKSSFQNSFDALSAAVEKSALDSTGKFVVTNKTVSEFLGNKQPEFTGDPGQTSINSHYYEAYVWRSAIKRKFVPPPKEPELLDTYAIFSGEVRPDLIKYRTKDLDKNRLEAGSFFDAYTIYVYYGFEDPDTNSREVIYVATTREPYFDDSRPVPTPAELEAQHKANLEIAIVTHEKYNPKLTPEQKEKMDSWKHPPEKRKQEFKVPGALKAHKRIRQEPLDPKDKPSLQDTPIAKLQRRIEEEMKAGKKPSEDGPPPSRDAPANPDGKTPAVKSVKPDDKSPQDKDKK